MAKKPISIILPADRTIEALHQEYYTTEDIDRVALIHEFLGEDQILAAKEIFGFILADCYYYEPGYFEAFVAEVCEIAKTKYNS